MRENHILYAEDDEDDAFFFTRAFLDFGSEHKLTIARDGSDAVARLRFSAPDLFLLDIRLPDRSGLEVLAWVRAQPLPLRDVPVIVISGSSGRADRNAARRLGALGYFGKTADAALLAQFVASICSFLNDESPERKWRCPGADDCQEFSPQTERR